MVANIPNGTFIDTTDFVKKFLHKHLVEAKQNTFAMRYKELIVGTGGAGKNRTQIITVMTNKITTVAGLVELLEEERQIRQIHLVLQTQDAEKKSYDTDTASEEEQKPSKLKVGNKKPPNKKPTAQDSRKGANKRIKVEDAKVKLESTIKVCCTTLSFHNDYI